MKIAKIDDINPDGLKVTIDWAAMDVGTSFFLPCINTESENSFVYFKSKKILPRNQGGVEDEELGFVFGELCDIHMTTLSCSPSSSPHL